MSELLNSVVLHLTQPQINKLRRGKVAQLKHSQFKEGAGLIPVPFKVDKKMLTKLNSALRNGKGIRLPPSEHDESDGSFMITGGKLPVALRKIKNTFRDVGRAINNSVIKPAGRALKNPKTLNAMKTIGKMASKYALPQLGEAAGLAVGTYFGNPLIGKEIGKAVASAGDKQIQGLGVRGRGRPRKIQGGDILGDADSFVDQQIVEPTGRLIKRNTNNFVQKHTNLSQNKLKRELGKYIPEGEDRDYLYQQIDDGANYVKRTASKYLTGAKKQPAPKSYGKQTKWGAKNAFGRKPQNPLLMPVMEAPEVAGSGFMTLKRMPSNKQVNYIPANGTLLGSTPVVVKRGIRGGSFSGNGYA